MNTLSQIYAYLPPLVVSTFSPNQRLEPAGLVSMKMARLNYYQYSYYPQDQE
jgi:hypothetical protein